MKFYGKLLVLLLFSFSTIGFNSQSKANENQLINKNNQPSELSVYSDKSINMVDSLNLSKNLNIKGTILDIAFSPDGSKILVASSRGFSLYSAKDLSFVWFADSYKMDAATIPSNGRFIENGAKILTNGTEPDTEYFYITNAADGKLLIKKPLEVQQAFIFELFPDADHILVDLRDGNSMIYSLSNNKEIPGDETTGCALKNSDQFPGNRVVTSRCNQLDIWNTEGNRMCGFNYDDLGRNEVGGWIEDVASFNNNNEVIVLTEIFKQYHIDITDVCDKKVIQSMPINNEEFEACSMDASNNGNDTLIAFGCGSWPNLPKDMLQSTYQINLMDLSNFGSIYKTTDLQVKEINIIKISPNNDRVLVADQRTGRLILLDKNGEIVGQNNDHNGLDEMIKQ